MKLMTLTINDFVKELSSASPAPGGGSVSAFAGVLCASLCIMVANLTLGKKKYQNDYSTIESAKEEAEMLLHKLSVLVDSDTQAYKDLAAAFKLPKSTEEEKKLRKNTIQEATKAAARVPMEILEATVMLSGPVKTVVQNGNPNCISDAGVGAQLLKSAAMGAAYNVLINLPGIDDEILKKNVGKEVTRLLIQVETIANEIENEIRNRLF
jgi:formiminotetrahydrofolate cyclodeaminase